MDSKDVIVQEGEIGHVDVLEIINKKDTLINKDNEKSVIKRIRGFKAANKAKALAVTEDSRSGISESRDVTNNNTTDKGKEDNVCLI